MLLPNVSDRKPRTNSSLGEGTRSLKFACSVISWPMQRFTQAKQMDVTWSLLSILDLNYAPYYPSPPGLLILHHNPYTSLIYAMNAPLKIQSDKFSTVPLTFHEKNKLLNQPRKINTTPTLDTEKIIFQFLNQNFQ